MLFLTTGIIRKLSYGNVLSDTLLTLDSKPVDDYVCLLSILLRVTKTNIISDVSNKTCIKPWCFATHLLSKLKVPGKINIPKRYESEVVQLVYIFLKRARLCRYRKENWSNKHIVLKMAVQIRQSDGDVIGVVFACVCTNICFCSLQRSPMIPPEQEYTNRNKATLLQRPN